MKKILIAGAVMALFGVAQAQTVSGTMRYDLTKAEGAVATTGITKSEVVFKATEDLGGGMSLAAQMGLNGNGRGETLAGTDASIAISGGFGTVSVGQVEAGNGIIGRAYAGAPVMGADGSVLGGAANVDSIKYTLPTIGGFSASIGGTRAVDATTARAYTTSVSGKVGPLDTGVDYNETTKRVRASAKVTVAGLTVGAGWSGRETGVADSKAFGVSTTLGALTVGAAYSDGNGTAKEFGASYALSKRTSVGYAYKTVADNTTSATNITTSRVRLQHKF